MSASLYTKSPRGYAPDTEVLTPEGWLSMSYPDLPVVAQYENIAGGLVSWAAPTNRKNVEYAGELVCLKNEFADLEVAPGQKLLVGKGRTRRAPSAIPAGDYRAHFGLPTSGLRITIMPLIAPTQARLVVAFQADGLLTNGSRGATVRKNPAWNLKKERKKNRIRQLLSEASVGWREQSFPSSAEWTLFTVRQGQLDWALSWLDDDAFKWGVLEWSVASRRAFLDETKYWDGDKDSRRSSRFYTSSKQAADVVDAMAVTTECSAIHRDFMRAERKAMNWKREHVCNLLENTTWRGSAREATRRTYSGTIHSLNVPSGYLAVRRNGKIGISGDGQPTTP